MSSEVQNREFTGVYPLTGVKTLAFTGNVTAGSLLVACITHYNEASNRISSVSDNLNGAWTVLTPIGSGTYSVLIAYKENSAGGACTVSVTLPAGNSDLWFSISERSGMATTSPLDNSNTATGTSASPSVGFSTTNANTVLYGVFAHNGADTALTEGTGFSLIQEQEGGSAVMPGLSEYKVVAASGSQTVNGSMGASALWLIMGAAFKESAGGGGGASAATSGTLDGSAEADIVAGGKTVVLTLTGDTYVAASAAADIEVIGTPQSGSGNNAQITLTFDVAPLENDVVIAWCGHDSNAGSSVTPVTSGYTQIINDTASQPYFGIWWKRMGASPDTTVVLPASGGANDAGVAGCIVLRNVDTSVLGATPTTAGPTASTNPNAPSITTTGTNSLVIAIAVSTSNDAAPGTVTNYTVFSSVGLNVSAVDMSASAARRVIAASGTVEDPPAWSAWTTGTWKAVTLEIVRAQTTPFNDQRANIAAGLDSAQSEANGWDAKVKPNIPVANVVRTSDTVCTITLQAQADYDITAQETVTATIPATALAGGSPLVATPDMTISPGGVAPEVDAFRYNVTRRGQKPGAFTPASAKFQKRFS